MTPAGRWGHAIAQLHQIRFPHFGGLAADGTVQEESDYLPALTRRATQTIKSSRLRDLFLGLLETRAGDFSDIETASLCHEDLHRHNILFARVDGQWQLATILDFDKVWAGHFETDLARLDFWDDMGGEAFWEAYRAMQPIYDCIRAAGRLILSRVIAASGQPHGLGDDQQEDDQGSGLHLDS